MDDDANEEDKEERDKKGNNHSIRSKIDNEVLIIHIGKLVLPLSSFAESIFSVIK